MHAQTTYRDIARTVGVSATTVSLALRGSTLISAKTRERVTTAAAVLGYRPNPLVAALMCSLRANRPKPLKAIIALISSGRESTRSRVHPAARQFRDVASRHARSLGYQVESIALDDLQSDRRRLDDMLRARCVTGLLLEDTGDLLPRLDLDWSRYTCVRIGSANHSATGPRLHSISADHFSLMQDLLAQTLARGRRRVGLVLTESIEQVTAGRYSAAFTHRRDAVGDNRLRGIHMVADLQARPVVDWIRSAQLDTVVTSDHRLLLWLREAGLRVPEDVAVVHTDATSPWWPLAGMEQDRESLARRAVEFLVSECNRNHRGLPAHPVHIQVPAAWRDGETLAPASAQSI